LLGFHLDPNGPNESQQFASYRCDHLADEFKRWSKWALAQADRIDPAIGERFLKAKQDEEQLSNLRAVAY
jgi:hypothetical protein